MGKIQANVFFNKVIIKSLSVVMGIFLSLMSPMSSLSCTLHSNTSILVHSDVTGEPVLPAQTPPHLQN